MDRTRRGPRYGRQSESPRLRPLRRLPSKRWQASYIGPDTARHTAPRRLRPRVTLRLGWAESNPPIAADTWVSPAERTRAARDPTVTFGLYAERWLRNRDLKPRTREHCRSLLDRTILPTFAHVPLRSVTPEDVGDWWADLDKSRPTLRAHDYSLMRTILGSAVQDRRLDANPCHIRGAGNVNRARHIEPATLTQLETLVSAMPQRYQPMVLIASWCALRFGELIELRRRDIDLNNGVVKVRRGAVRAEGTVVVGDPKTDAARRDMAVPPHLMPLLPEHLSQPIVGGRDGLLFPAADGTSTLAPSTFYRSSYRAREAAGRPDLRCYDLRHTGVVLAAQTGATLAELMGRLGHSTPAAALRYQHAARGRDAEIALALSKIAEATPARVQDPPQLA